MTSKEAIDDPVLAAMTRLVVEQFAPERLILFGSRARGDYDEWSDYDLCVVADTSVPYGYRDAPIREALRGLGHGVDVVVYTPAEYERRRDDVGTLVYACEVEGQVLYEKTPRAGPPRVREEPAGRPESAAWWVERAENDFQVMERLLTAEMPPRDAVCFHAHQCVEKLLKTVLILQHVRPKRIHDLLELLALCPEPLRHDSRLIRACAVLMAVWPKSRYAEERMPTAEEAREAVEAAREARGVLLGALSG